MKTFNGRKMSHGGENRSMPKCPLCKTIMKMVGGQLRCAELRSTRTSKGSSARILVKHGSMRTIKKRQKRGYPARVD